MKILNKLFLIFAFVLTFFSLSSFNPHPVSAESCGGPFPPKPAAVWAKSGPGSGEVTLYWSEAAYADRYAVAYGTKSGDYIYGATNIGGSEARSYTVSALTAGVRYYFKLAAARGCTSSPFSDEVTARAAGGATIQATGAAVAVSYQPSSKSSSWSAVSGPAVGEVTLRWSQREDADNYHLVYGTVKGTYQYGALNIGKVSQFTVRSLVPGRGYYFAIVPVKGNRALYTSDPVWGVAKAAVVAVEVVQTTPTNLMQITPTYIPTDIPTYVPSPVVTGGAEENGEGNVNEPEDVYQNNGAPGSDVQGVNDENQDEPQDQNYGAENQSVNAPSY